jgi:diguanylate cyclase (GGDEF)-like protein
MTRTLRTPSRPEVRALVYLVFAAAAGCGATAAFPPARATPVELLIVLSALAAASGVALLVAGPRVTLGITVGVIVLMSTLASVLVGASATTGGAMLVGYAYVWMTVYIAMFLPRWAMRVHATLVTAGFGAGLLASGLPDMFVSWVLVSGTVWVFGEALVTIAERVRHHAETDLVTGLLNRRAFVAAAEREHELAGRTGAELSIVLIDLDDFKLVNDREGHAAGDRLLADLAAAWQGALRPADVLGRHGGDEFAVLLPATSVDGAVRVVERLREAHPMSWSSGAAAWAPGQTLDAVLAAADARLYEAKRARPARHEASVAPGAAAAPAPGPAV